VALNAPAISWNAETSRPAAKAAVEPRRSAKWNEDRIHWCFTYAYREMAFW
jgi:hypothetical protein